MSLRKRHTQGMAAFPRSSWVADPESDTLDISCGIPRYETIGPIVLLNRRRPASNFKRRIRALLRCRQPSQQCLLPITILRMSRQKGWRLRSARFFHGCEEVDHAARIDIMLDE